MKRTLFLSITIAVIWQLSLLVVAREASPPLLVDALLAKARIALGGEAKLNAITSLSINGVYRRVLADRETGGDIEFEVLLPDKIRRTETMSPVPHLEITRIEVLNGAQVWFDTQSNSSGGNIVIRRPGADGPNSQAVADDAVRAEMARFLLGFLLTGPSSVPLQYAYVGEAEAPEGKAEAIDVTGPNKFAARLFIDQKTHRPLMLSYRGRAPRMTVQTFTGPPGHREETERRIREGLPTPEVSPEVEIQIAFDDYRAVDGVLFPHSLSRVIDGKVTEETTIKKIRVNAPIKSDRFEKKPTS